MKNLLSTIILTALSISGLKVQAQKKDETKIAAIKQAVESKNFVFTMEYAKTGNEQDVKSDIIEYRLFVKNGVVTSYLPTVSKGRLYITTTVSNVKNTQFQSKKYELTTTEKKGKYILNYKLLDCLDARQLTLEISPNGEYSYARILTYNGAPTSYTGVITPLNTEKLTDAEQQILGEK